MNIDLPPEEQSLIEQLVAAGRFSTPYDAVVEGVRLLISREKLKEQIELGIKEADCGNLLEHDTVFSHLRASLSVVQE